MKSGVYRDTQRHLVYAWENNGILAKFWNNRISKEDVVNICHQILRDTGNNFRIPDFKIKFNVRNGWACGGYTGVRFTPQNLSKIVVIHEMAHAISIKRCNAGHDANFVSCYMALLEKYLGINILDLAKSLREPVTQIQKVFVQTPEIEKIYDQRRGVYVFKNKCILKNEVKILKPPVFNPHELRHWRTILNGGTSLV